MPDTDPRRLISNYFDKVHNLLSDVKEQTAFIDDPTALELAKSLEYQTVVAMRRLRLHLRIPYQGWNEQ